MTNDDLVFLILNYKNYRMTISAVENILQNIKDLTYRILIVDNGSPNSSYEILENYFKDFQNIKVIYAKKNMGYAVGNNLGLRFIKESWGGCRYVAVMNPDVAFFPQTNISRLVNILNSCDYLAAVSPVHLLNGEFSSKNIGWKIPEGFDDLLLNFSILNKIFRPVEDKFFVNRDKIAFTEVLPGSFFVIKFDIFDSVGFFDENTFLYCEERILGKKLKDKGYKLAVDFLTFYIHDHSHKSNLTLKRKIWDYNRLLCSRVYFNKRYNDSHFCKWITIIGLIVLYPFRIAEIFLWHLLSRLIRK